MPEVAVDTRVCPYCAETIRAAAKKCRYCGSNLADSIGEEMVTAATVSKMASELAIMRLEKEIEELQEALDVVKGGGVLLTFASFSMLAGFVLLAGGSAVAGIALLVIGGVLLVPAGAIEKQARRKHRTLQEQLDERLAELEKHRAALEGRGQDTSGAGAK
jgi:hypothetical protein